MSLFDLFHTHHTYNHTHKHTHTCSHTQHPKPPSLLQFNTIWRKKRLNADICHMCLAATDIEVSPMFRRDFFPPPRPNQVTVNFPAVSEQASDKARPNRTDGWALFAFCCYLFMCLFFLSLSPLIHPFLPLPQVPTRKQCLVTSGVICTHSKSCVCLK